MTGNLSDTDSALFEQRISEKRAAILAALELGPGRRMSMDKYTQIFTALMECFEGMLADLPPELCEQMLPKILRNVPIEVLQLRAEFKKRNQMPKIIRWDSGVSEKVMAARAFKFAKAIERAIGIDPNAEYVCITQAAMIEILNGLVPSVVAVIAIGPEDTYQATLTDVLTDLPRAVAERRAEIGRDQSIH
jgi:hypothetical protein